MGSVHRTMAGQEGSVGVRDATPPRKRITCKGGAFGLAEIERKRSATIAAGFDAPFSSVSRTASACCAVESTRSRRLTTHQMRVGAVRWSGGRVA